jgi:alpha-1,2-mannosyltransferase
MTGLREAFRTGEWLTAARIRGYSLIVLGIGLAMLGWLIAASDGLNDTQGRPLGTDFSNVYAAGKWVLEGRPNAPFDPALQHDMEKRIFGAETPFYGWHYPPVFLGVAALLATMPYLLALLVWQGVTLALYFWVMRGILPVPGAWLPALAFPAVFINIGHGHNGFLSAALFGGGLVLLNRPALLQAAAWHDDPRGTGGRPAMACVHRSGRHGDRARDTFMDRARRRCVDRVPRKP